MLVILDDDAAGGGAEDAPVAGDVDVEASAADRNDELEKARTTGLRVHPKRRRMQRSNQYICSELPTSPVAHLVTGFTRAIRTKF